MRPNSSGWAYLVFFQMPLILFLLLNLIKLDGLVQSQENLPSLSHEQVIFNQTPVPIIPFNAKKLLKLEDGLEEFPPLGPVRVIRGLMASPSFSSICISIYTRNNVLTDIYLKPLEHIVTAEDGTQSEVKYEYNLTQLAKPSNPFDHNKRTVMIIPGYMTGLYVEWMQDFRKSWLELEDVNVILVHWSGGNKGLYSTAVSNVKLIARQITIFLYYLTQLNGLDFKSSFFRKSLTLVGHSLGAHVAAFVGQELDGQVGRITGLDPAGPIFDKQKSIDRIDPSDAILVDILHTNGGKMRYMKAGLGLLKNAGKKLLDLWNFRKASTNKSELAESLLTSYSSDDEAAWYGLEYPSGHLDYYANGGSIQPGCNDQLHLCDHGRATAIYRNALKFELRARQIYGKQSDTLQRGLHRLVAFPSADYVQFLSGSSILRNCPMLIMGNHLMNPRAREMAYKQCTVPIDFVMPGPKFRRYLEEEYSLPLSSLDKIPDRPLIDWRAGDFEERRLYFQTMSREPLVGEQHLMQVHMARHERVSWSKGCRFTCKIGSRENKDLFSLVDYLQESLEPLEYNQFYGMCFVLANPNDWRYESSADEELSLDQFENGRNMGAPDEEDEQHMPRYLLVELSYNGVSLNNIRMASLEPKESQKTQCKMNINAVKMRPLTALVYNVTSWYDNYERPPEGKESILHSKNEGGIGWSGRMLSSAGKSLKPRYRKSSNNLGC